MSQGNVPALRNLGTGVLPVMVELISARRCGDMPRSLAPIRITQSLASFRRCLMFTFDWAISNRNGSIEKGSTGA
jgi:hypothetical protein